MWIDEFVLDPKDFLNKNIFDRWKYKASPRKPNIWGKDGEKTPKNPLQEDLDEFKEEFLDELIKKNTAKIFNKENFLPKKTNPFVKIKEVIEKDPEEKIENILSPKSDRIVPDENAPRRKITRPNQEKK